MGQCALTVPVQLSRRQRINRPVISGSTGVAPAELELLLVRAIVVLADRPLHASCHRCRWQQQEHQLWLQAMKPAKLRCIELCSGPQLLHNSFGKCKFIRVILGAKFASREQVLAISLQFELVFSPSSQVSLHLSWPSGALHFASLICLFLCLPSQTECAAAGPPLLLHSLRLHQLRHKSNFDSFAN